MVLAIGLDLMTGFSLACEARLILAPDSAFVHLAGARGVPCVGIFGPTDGNLRLGVYPEATVVSLAPHMTCIPCWRNQATPCMLTGGSTSQCLESLPVAQVVDAVKELLAATNPRVPSP
jgi:heptosyltransferase-3